MGRTHADSNLFGDAADEKGYVNQHGGSRKHVFESVKHSLERLQLDYVDVLQVHRLDPDTPYEEMVRALVSFDAPVRLTGTFPSRCKRCMTSSRPGMCGTSA